MDTLIAHRLGVSHMAVYLYRKQLGIRSEQVRETRYDTWIRLLEEGRSVEAVASLYEVKPDTILTTLYRTREFSYPEVKERARLAKEEDMRRALGVTVRDLQAQRMQAWVKLGQAGMTVEQIAETYDVDPKEVTAVLRKHKVSVVKPKVEEASFDW
ncbi:MAG: hypothetical protein JSV72_02745 [Ralstonia sp.]|jgi:ribosomal protein S11|uniref:Helix-turn-helix domain-containing protein n=2 Tax=Ralstonia pseudosolanacearum TaxID=1310165 RepID=A0A454TLR4_9RALS|nr:hypothetical protein EGA29_19940 [Ralstonia pseudosolanacearum]UCF24417.1 MAG: hypothetical protein JSV72_02745 [Ralstonia sp.]